MLSCEYSKSFRGSFFYRTTPVAASELSFSIRKEYDKNKVSGEIFFALIRLVFVQIQESASRSTTTEHLSFFQNLLNFIIAKYLKQDLSICVDEHSPCDLSVTGDLKCPRAPYGLISKSCFYCQNLITVAPL